MMAIATTTITIKTRTKLTIIKTTAIIITTTTTRRIRDYLRLNGAYQAPVLGLPAARSPPQEPAAEDAVGPKRLGARSPEFDISAT